MQRIRIKYTKGPEVKFISHLDIIRTFERAIRRADIPIGFSRGYNPRMSISWGPPLSVGIGSVCELADLYIEGWTKPNKLIEALNAVLPAGIKILEATIAGNDGSLDATIDRAEYLIDAQYEGDLKGRLEDILKLDKIEIEKDGKIVNKRQMLYELDLVNNSTQIRAIVQVGNHGTLKPKEILNLIPGIKVKSIARTKLFES